MDDISTRLKETSDNCMKAYEVWSKDNKNVTAREDLQETLHELRKVAARLEIDVAVSERDANGKPLPIPGHNSYSRGRQKPRKQMPPKKPQAPKTDAGNELPSFISGGDDKKKPSTKGTLTTKPADKDTKTA